MLGLKRAQRADEIFDFAVVQLALFTQDPALLPGFILGVEGTRQFPQMLSGVIQIDDLNRAWEVLIGYVPDPLGAVGDDHFLFGPAPPALPGFSVDATAKLVGRFHGSGVGGGSLIAGGPALFMGSGLRENGAQFDFARARRLPFDAAGAAFQFQAHHRNLPPVHFDIQHGNRGAQNLRQFQLQGVSRPGLLALDDIGAYGFGLPLDGRWS